MTTTITASGFSNVDEMYRDAIYAMPVDYDWTEHSHGEDWDFIEYRPPEEGDEADCAECSERVTYHDGEWRHNDAPLSFDEADQDAYDHDAAPDAEYTQDPDYCEGPMMSYWYPVEIRGPKAAAERIADLPVCVVIVGEETGLALTGGGMDLSWEICEAFLRIGNLPPVHFCTLPKMAGRGSSDRDRWIVAGCRRSAEILRLDSERLTEHLDGFRAESGGGRTALPNAILGG